ncbi:MAG: CPBP family intramembrane metalloprotease [Myxococcales bacterium]|nr:CPBP family intramembrane metalloprotease [Myxococcales bacterium]MCB9733782.1 CPBP family intramembrane metalloprotease [Deltaproteobacteria bacterium]
MTRDRIIDVLLVVATMALAGWKLFEGLEPSGEEAAATSHMAVRSLEDYGRVQDASLAYPDAVRTLIGLEGAPEATPAAVMGEAADRVRALRWSGELRLVVAAMAASFEADEVARELLAEIEQNDTARARLGPLVAEVRRLSTGEPLRAPDALVDGLRGGRWLSYRVRARDAKNRHDDVAARELVAQAQAVATASMDALTVEKLVEYALLFLGFLLVAGSGPLRKALLRRDLVGLGTTRSPFVVASTQRVLLLWFIASLVLDALRARWFGDADVHTQVVAMAVLMLLQGVVAVALIRALGTGEDDHRPLAARLRLDRASLPRSPLAFAAWPVAGLAVTAFAMTTAIFLNLVLFGRPSDAQTAIDLVLESGDGGTFGLLLLAAGLFAPLAEEILFRGFLYRNLRDVLGRTGAVFFSGFVFGAVHLDPERLVPLAGLGMVLAVLYEWSGALAVPIVVHGLWNLLQLISVWAIYHGA